MSQERTSGQALGLIGLALLGLTLVLWIVFGFVDTGPEPDSRVVVDAPLVAAALAGLAGVIVSARGRSPRALALSAAVLGVSVIVLLLVWLLTATTEIGG